MLLLCCYSAATLLLLCCYYAATMLLPYVTPAGCRLVEAPARGAEGSVWAVTPTPDPRYRASPGSYPLDPAPVVSANPDSQAPPGVEFRRRPPAVCSAGRGRFKLLQQCRRVPAERDTGDSAFRAELCPYYIPWVGLACIGVGLCRLLVRRVFNRCFVPYWPGCGR